MKPILNIFLLIFNFNLFSFVFIDHNIEQYFNEEYIKKAKIITGRGDFYLFEIDKNEKKVTVAGKSKTESGIEFTTNEEFIIYRSINKAKCNSFNETTKSNESIDNVYLDVVINNIENNDGILYVDNVKDDPEKYLTDHGNLRYKDKNYIDMIDKESMIFKIVVEENDPTTKAINKKEIYCFCSNMLYLYAIKKREDENFYDSFEFSLFNNKKIKEFYLIDPLLKYETMENNIKNKDKKRIPNDYKTELGKKIDGDIDGLIFYDEDDIDNRSEISLRDTFKKCLNLRKISFKNNNTYYTLTNDIFRDCENLEELDIKNIIFLNLIYFRNFNKLKSLKLNYQNKNHTYSFAYCKELEEIKFVNDDGSENVIDEMKVGNAGFKDCPELTYIGAKKIIIDSKCGNTRIFENCKKLKIPDVVVLLHKNISLDYLNLKNIFNDLDPKLNEEVKLEFKYVDNDSKIRYNLDFNTIFNGCNSKKNIEITSPDGNKKILEDVQNNDKINEFLLNPKRYINHREFYQNCTEEQLKNNNYFEGINLDDENIRNAILNNTYNNNFNVPNIDKNLNEDTLKNASCLSCCGKCCKCCCCKRNV